MNDPLITRVLVVLTLPLLIILGTSIVRLLTIHRERAKVLRRREWLQSEVDNALRRRIS
jgi:hypothetical protein